MSDFFKPKKQVLKTPQQAYSELLGNSEENQIVELNCDLIDEIDEQPQSIHQDKIERIAESMKYIGQVDPITVVPSDKTEGRYTLLAGRHRRRACMLNGNKTVKAIIRKETNPDKQRLILLATNNDRETDYLPSERAFSFAEQAELLKKLGNKATASAIAEQNHTNRKAVHRHIRLTFLIKPLLNRIDNGSITVGAGYELSFLNEEQQISVLNFILNHPDKSKIDVEIAREIRLDPDNLNSIFYPPVNVPALINEKENEETEIAEKSEMKAEEKDTKTENKTKKCPTVGHLTKENELSDEVAMSIAAIVINDSSSILKFYLTSFPLYSDVENMITQQFVSTKHNSNYNSSSYDIPFSKYSKCIYHIFFGKKLEIKIYDTVQAIDEKYIISYKSLDNYIRKYLRSYFTKEQLIEAIKNT